MKTGCWMGLINAELISGKEVYAISMPIIWASNKKTEEETSREILNHAREMIVRDLPELESAVFNSCNLLALDRLEFSTLEQLVRIALVTNGLARASISLHETKLFKEK